MSTFSKSARAIAAFLTLAMLAAPLASAVAQSRDEDDAAASAASSAAAAAAKKKKLAVPRALPGSHIDASDPAPLERPPSEMKPNEALFDGVNRGDAAAVREALARGAELETPNMLGQTATELSIDLGRNDITFLLLSMRGAIGRPAARTATNVTSAPIAAKPAPIAKPVAVAAPRPVAAPAPVAPKPFVNNPGTPAPQSGFLGFGRSGQ